MEIRSIKFSIGAPIFLLNKDHDEVPTGSNKLSKTFNK